MSACSSARADGGNTTIVSAPCSVQGTAAGMPTTYAVQSFPGRTKEDLAVNVFVLQANPGPAANVAVLLSGDLLRLVGIAVLIACPIAAYTMHKWLENFNYRTPLSWWI